MTIHSIKYSNVSTPSERIAAGQWIKSKYWTPNYLLYDIFDGMKHWDSTAALKIIAGVIFSL